MPGITSEYFWDSLEQAHQRLSNSIILYDGVPCLVHEINDHTDGVPRAHIQLLPGQGQMTTKSLASPKFGKFRQSVPLGFINHYYKGKIRQCSYLERTTPRTVVHGLNNNNTTVFRFYADGTFEAGGGRITDLINDQSFLDMAIGNYPAFRLCVDNLLVESTVGVHRQYALAKDGFGKVFLYRERAKIAEVSNDGNTILLLHNKLHWKEELQDLTRDSKSFRGVSVREL